MALAVLAIHERKDVDRKVRRNTNKNYSGTVDCSVPAKQGWPV
jgi:hypothetical protein